MSKVLHTSSDRWGDWLTKVHHTILHGIIIVHGVQKANWYEPRIVFNLKSRRWNASSFNAQNYKKKQSHRRLFSRIFFHLLVQNLSSQEKTLRKKKPALSMLVLFCTLENDGSHLRDSRVYRKLSIERNPITQKVPITQNSFFWVVGLRSIIQTRHSRGLEIPKI